jgi:protein-tyrosine phosphatase
LIEPFAIHVVPMAGGGDIGLCRMPGRAGDLAADLDVIAAWRPRVVVSLTDEVELAAHAGMLRERLARSCIPHRHFPIKDYGVPTADGPAWSGFASGLHAVLDDGGRVLVHCMGGCGRSGMIALRLMVEQGEVSRDALARLREVRPCAVETEAQMAWATHPSLRS